VLEAKATAQEKSIEASVVAAKAASEAAAADAAPPVAAPSTAEAPSSAPDKAPLAAPAEVSATEVSGASAAKKELLSGSEAALLGALAKPRYSGRWGLCSATRAPSWPRPERRPAALRPKTIHRRLRRRARRRRREDVLLLLLRLKRHPAFEPGVRGSQDTPWNAGILI
jgi:hypothetical protein